MVDFLMKFHPEEGLRLYCIICPAYIPIHSICSLLFFPSEVFGYFANDWVLAIYLKWEIPDILITIFVLFLEGAFLSFF
jgi:hypothetical protein